MCGSCCCSAADAAQDCPDPLCDDTTKSCYFDHLLCLSAYFRLLNFKFCSFSKPTISHGVWSIAPDSDFRLTWGYPVSLMLLTWGMLLLPLCASWGKGVCSVWKVVDRICTSTYTLFTLQILLLLSTISSLWLFLGEIAQDSLKMYFFCPCKNQLVRESKYTIFRRHFFNALFLQLFESNDL